MFSYDANNEAQIVTEINELRLRFDKMIIEGKCFEEVKKVYIEIKRLEVQMHVIRWNRV